MKKDKGNAIIYPTLAIAALLIFALIFVMIISTKSINTAQDIENISHRYLLEMEYEGGLTDESYQNLKTELEAAGVTDISLEGTTRTSDAAGYGEPAYLSISGSVETFNDTLLENIHTTKRFTIKKSIISKMVVE